MDFARQTVEYRPDCVDRFPEGQHEDAGKRHDVEHLMHGEVGLDHGDIEGSKNGDAVDGEMGGGDEEAGGGRHDDGDEGGRLLLVGDERVD